MRADYCFCLAVVAVGSLAAPCFSEGADQNGFHGGENAIQVPSGIASLSARHLLDGFDRVTVVDR